MKKQLQYLVGLLIFFCISEAQALKANYKVYLKNSQGNIYRPTNLRYYNTASGNFRYIQSSGTYRQVIDLKTGNIAYVHHQGLNSQDHNQGFASLSAARAHVAGRQDSSSNANRQQPFATLEDFGNPFIRPTSGEVTGNASSSAAPPPQKSEGFLKNFLSRFVDRSPDGPHSRYGNKIYQWPMGGETHTIGPCGSKHIRPQRTKPYMNPTAACMMTGFAQEWKTQFCPNDAPDCQLLFGDIGYGKQKPSSWPHASHKKGECVDIWPVRKPGYSGELDIRSEGYDQARTYEMTKLLMKWGIETKKTRSSKPQFFFNDAKIRNELGARYFAAHDDHLHVCFRNSEANRKRCQDLEVDLNKCPTLK